MAAISSLVLLPPPYDVLPAPAPELCIAPRYVSERINQMHNDLCVPLLKNRSCKCNETEDARIWRRAMKMQGSKLITGIGLVVATWIGCGNIVDCNSTTTLMKEEQKTVGWSGTSSPTPVNCAVISGQPPQTNYENSCYTTSSSRNSVWSICFLHTGQCLSLRTQKTQNPKWWHGSRITVDGR